MTHRLDSSFRLKWSRPRRVVMGGGEVEGRMTSWIKLNQTQHDRWAHHTESHQIWFLVCCDLKLLYAIQNIIEQITCASLKFHFLRLRFSVLTCARYHHIWTINLNSVSILWHLHCKTHRVLVGFIVQCLTVIRKAKYGFYVTSFQPIMLHEGDLPLWLCFSFLRLHLQVEFKVSH